MRIKEWCRCSSSPRIRPVLSSPALRSELLMLEWSMGMVSMEVKKPPRLVQRELQEFHSEILEESPCKNRVLLDAEMWSFSKASR